ncbi:hypothetical protein FisN_13Lu030 [Fistulifera solaris]|uniref:Uncharacterized protein n=1 Tax=Fistulifera solaris TaxID=1519565 RepID=A0A1Z5JEY1_FISSO|nr:hypothetical protein FisN_13Lu030 [Fistulifera solaris]|eukprot:GAX12565.1 hypothetical protein FisN_13Lu030 [Fistulifera solaris]
MSPVLSRTAMALNNMGVEMLHRHLFKEALATLHDATRLMKEILTNQSVEDEWHVLRRAQLRLCQRYSESFSQSSAKNVPVFMDLTDDPISFIDSMAVHEIC